MKWIATALAAAATVSAGLGLGLATAGSAQATTYCPGQGYLAEDPWPGFDRSVCHHYEYAPGPDGTGGMLDDDTGIFHAWAPAPPPPPDAPHGAVCIGPIVISGPAWQCAL